MSHSVRLCPLVLFLVVFIRYLLNLVWPFLFLNVCRLKRKQLHNLKVENYVLFCRYSEDLSPGHSTSDKTEDSSKETRRSQDIQELLQPGSQNLKRVPLIKENQTSQVKEFNDFLCMGGYKRLAHWNHSFDMHLSSLGPVSCFSPSWVPSGCNVWLVGGGGRLQWLRAWQWAACLSPAWVPSMLTVPVAVMWWLDGCNILCLVIWHTIFFIHIWFRRGSVDFL